MKKQDSDAMALKDLDSAYGHPSEKCLGDFEMKWRVKVKDKVESHSYSTIQLSGRLNRSTDSAWAENSKDWFSWAKNISVDRFGQIPEDVTNWNEEDSFKAHGHVSREKKNNK